LRRHRQTTEQSCTEWNCSQIYDCCQPECGYCTESGGKKQTPHKCEVAARDKPRYYAAARSQMMFCKKQIYQSPFAASNCCRGRTKDVEREQLIAPNRVKSCDVLVVPDRSFLHQLADKSLPCPRCQDVPALSKRRIAQ
jgi:hypothetical protein